MPSHGKTLRDVLSKELDGVALDAENVYEDGSDHSSAEVISALYEARERLPPSSLISTWFDLVLRNAFKETSLSRDLDKQLHALILLSLSKQDPANPEMVHDFRRRVIEFYLHDAFNENSGEDVLDHFQMDPVERERHARWKFNLDRLLVDFGLQQPEEVFSLVNRAFTAPEHRLQLAILMDHLVSHVSFHSIAAKLAEHDLFISILYSLRVDKSSTLATLLIGTIVKLIPLFAIYAESSLTKFLPWLLVILARLICWRERAFIPEDIEADEKPLEDSPQDELLPEFEWKRLRATFAMINSDPPSPLLLFRWLYYLFPSNLLQFLRGPIEYTRSSALSSVYVVGWEGIFDEKQIQSKCRFLLRQHTTHFALVVMDPQAELEIAGRWELHTVERLAGEVEMLHISNAAIGFSERVRAEPHIVSQLFLDAQRAKASPTQFERSSEASKSNAVDNANDEAALKQPHVSLRDLANTYLLLRSGAPVIPLPSSTTLEVPHLTTSTSEPKNGGSIFMAMKEAIASLQREALLVRAELNLELWMKRENVRHLGRLYQDQIQFRGVESEQQALHNKLRDYRTLNTQLQQELGRFKKENNVAFAKRKEWQDSSTSKLNEQRKRVGVRDGEISALRADLAEQRESFKAQGSRLADLEQKVFALETQIKESAPKVARLEDYEKKITLQTETQKLWDKDVRELNELREQMQIIMSNHRKQEMLMESQRQGSDTSRRALADAQLKIQTLESELKLARNRHNAASKANQDLTQSLISRVESLTQADAKLRSEKEALLARYHDAMVTVETLRSQVGAEPIQNNLGG